MGAIEYIHRELVKQRDAGTAILLISLELDEVMNLSDRILVMFEGTIVADLNPGEVTVQELGLYMAGSKRQEPKGKQVRAVSPNKRTGRKRDYVGVLSSVFAIVIGLW